MIKIIIPLSPILKRHIECFYIYTGETTSTFRYLAFPHYNTGLSFIKGATIHRKHPQVTISENKKNEVKIELLGKYNCPLLIEYAGKLQELSIIFKPLGLNHFFRKNYQTIAPQFTQELVHEPWNAFGDTLQFEETYLVVLESFLLSQFKENPELDSLQKALSMLTDANDETPIAEIVAQLGYNLKTFQRHFKKHLGTSPVEYRRICRFRNAIEAKWTDTQLKTLTDLTYHGGYYDQSYFTKEFRKLTNHNPKDFFKLTNKIDGDKLVWEII
jgi:AraC-like DNA-binding protein